jgi:hypothetical protein
MPGTPEAVPFASNASQTVRWDGCARRPERVSGLVSQQRRRNRGKHGRLADLLKNEAGRSQQRGQPSARTRYSNDSFLDRQLLSAVNHTIMVLGICMFTSKRLNPSGLLKSSGENPQVKQRVFDGPETLANLLILNGLLKLTQGRHLRFDARASRAKGGLRDIGPDDRPARARS